MYIRPNVIDAFAEPSQFNDYLLYLLFITNYADLDSLCIPFKMTYKNELSHIHALSTNVMVVKKYHKLYALLVIVINIPCYSFTPHFSPSKDILSACT